MFDSRDDLLAGLSCPAAPPGLRERALAAAKDPGVAASQRRIEDRIWESRPLRLAWLATAAVLVVLNLAVEHRGAAQAPAIAAAAQAPSIEDEVGIEIPPAAGDGMTLAEAYQLAVALLNDPCLDPFSEGDCT